MRTVMTLIMLFTFSSLLQAAPTQRKNALLNFIAQQHRLRDYALYSLIGERCSRYLPEREALLCQQAVKKEIALLDYDIIFSSSKHTAQDIDTWDPQAFVFIAFKENLINLLATRQTKRYLEDLHQKLNSYFVGELAELNIWELTLTHYPSPLEAAKVMAALFQDTTGIKLHLAYLERTRVEGRGFFETNKELLSAVIDSINLILDYNESYYRKLFYPKAIQGTLNRNIYHFYVPLYLSMALLEEGVSARYARIAPLMLTLTYEFITTSHDYRYIFSDPAYLHPTAHLWKLKDIYGGYCGVRFGTNRPMGFDFEKIRNTFSHSTAQAVRLLISLNH
jgi:hypothetical protein